MGSCALLPLGMKKRRTSGERSFITEKTVKSILGIDGTAVGPNGHSRLRRECAVQAFSPQAKTLAQGWLCQPEHSDTKGWSGPSGGEIQNKRTSFLMVPIGTFSEPGELSGTEADGGSRPPLCFHANNRMIPSFSVICFVMCGAESPSRMGVSSAPMSRYTIRTL